MVKERRFIFVCSGNICRSPMAETIARRRFEEASIPARFISMGTLGIFGSPASEFALAVCEEHGLDLSQHASQGLSLGLMHQADAVLVMERDHRDYLRARLPELSNVHLLSEFESRSAEPDIADPIGSTRSDYLVCFERISRAVDGLIQRIRIGLL